VLRERRYLHFTIATVAFTAAMLAKPTAIVTPLICFTLDYWFLRRPVLRILRPMLYWALLGVPVAWVASRVQGTGAVNAYIPLLQRPVIAGDAILFYLGKLITPWGLVVDYGRRPDVVLNDRWLRWAWLVPLVIAAWVVVRRRKRPWLLAASIVFIAPLLPVLGLMAFQMQHISTVADHYLYLAMLGPAVAMASILTRRRERHMAIACTLLFAAFMFRSARQVMFWKDDQALCRHTLFVNPESWTAHTNLGQDLKEQGDPDASRAEFATAVEENPNWPMCQRDLALAEINFKNWDSMEYHGQKLMALERHFSIEAQRQFAADYALIGKQFIYQHQPARAVPFLDEAVRLKPDLQEARDDLTAAHQMFTAKP
jgi:hypothetical protein